MFADSIERVAGFTRPVHTIIRTYGGKQIVPGSATLFFVNENGVAITCKHVINLLANAEKINQFYVDFVSEKKRIPQDENFAAGLQALEIKYNYTPDTIVQIKTTFVDCVDTMTGFTWHEHPKFDLAILQFHGFQKTLYSGAAHFLKDLSKLRQGNFLCRLGFPFPEFTNYIYQAAIDDIQWTNSGNPASPRFPTEGMVTRFLGEGNTMYGIELSTPGLKGQSGGPLFNQSGTIYGMQFSTKHMHLGFDQENKELSEENKMNHPSFLHLGQCIHASIIKEFLAEKKIVFFEE